MKEDIEIQNFGNKNILEEFYELIEKHRLGTNKEFELINFYNYLSQFDDAYQKFNSNCDSYSSRLVYNQLLKSLYPFLVIFKLKGFSDRPIFHSFERYIKYYTLLLSKLKNIKSEFFFQKNISINFPSLLESDFVKYIQKDEFNLNLINPNNYNDYDEMIEKAERKISRDFELITGFYKTGAGENKDYLLFLNNFEIQLYNFNIKLYNFSYKENYYEMTLDIKISYDDNDAQKLLQTLFQIITSLSNINNNKTELEKIEVGSLYARVKVWMKDIVAKEETKAVIETTKEIVTKTLTAGQVSHTETKNLTAQTNKIKTEQKLLDKELSDKPNEFQVQMTNALELERKALENERLKNEIVKERLSIIQTLSDLSAKGIVEADQVRIDINEVLYLLKSHEKIEESDANIDDVA